jgi:hypothetical protein
LKAPKAAPLPRGAVVGVAVLGVVALVALAVFIRDYVPHHNWLFSGHYALGFGDLLSRKRDIFRIHHGSNVYSLHDHHQYFTYPPAALFVFWPLSWASFHTDALIWTLVCLSALAGSIAIVWRTVLASPTWTIAAGSLWGSVAAVVIFPVISIGLALGQLGLLLMLLLALDYLVLRGPAKGIATGVAAAIKIYPVVFIVGWLLRREWRPAVTALFSGAVTSALAWAVWPHFTATFVSRQLFSGRELTHFLHNLHWRATSSSPYTIFFRWPFHGGSWASPVGWVASLAVVALGLWGAQRTWRAGLRATSFVVLLGASVLAGPVTWDHYYTFAPLLVFVVIENWHRRVLVVAALVAMVTYALPWQLDRNESFSVVGFSAHELFIFVGRNALSAATVVVMIAAIYVTRSNSEHPHDALTPVAKV